MINKMIEIDNISKEYITGIINYKNFIDDLKSKFKKDKHTSFQKEKKPRLCCSVQARKQRLKLERGFSLR